MFPLYNHHFRIYLLKMMVASFGFLYQLRLRFINIISEIDYKEVGIDIQLDCG